MYPIMNIKYIDIKTIRYLRKIQRSGHSIVIKAFITVLNQINSPAAVGLMSPRILAWLHANLNNLRNHRAFYLRNYTAIFPSLKISEAGAQVLTLNRALWLAGKLHSSLMSSLFALLREMAVNEQHSIVHTRSGLSSHLTDPNWCLGKKTFMKWQKNL